MRVIVFGAGSLGSLVGGLLTRRHEVVLVGRQPHVQAIEGSGLTIAGMVEAVVVPHATDSIRGLPPGDMVLVTVKSYDTVAALEAIKPLVTENTLVVSLQNGLRNAELVTNAYPGNAVVGVTSLGATMSSPGRVYYAGEGDTYFGTLKGEAVNAEKVAEAFNSVGLDSYVTKDIMAEVWAKTIINASINPLTALVRCKNGRILKDDGLLKVAEMACREGERVAQALGLSLGSEDVFERVKLVLRRTSDNKSSMLQDLERRKRTEIDEISGELVLRAEGAGLQAQVNRTLWLLVRSITKYE
ncbi:MAG TPA: 2-dehydropantoate 2-reductase [Methanomassiliicoccales archaeon]|nr:2-dehydropantoate 2-reductase [Methanomassiliicoccales archaeon]